MPTTGRRARAKVLAISREDQLAPVDEALASMFVIDAQPSSEAAISPKELGDKQK